MSLAVLENPAFTLDINKLIHNKVIACESPNAAHCKQDLRVFFCQAAQWAEMFPSSRPACRASLVDGGTFFYLVNNDGKRNMALDKGWRRRCRREADRDRGMSTHI